MLMLDLIEINVVTLWKKMEETQNVSQGKEIVEVEVEASHTPSKSKELITYVRRRKNNQ